MRDFWYAAVISNFSSSRVPAFKDVQRCSQATAKLHKKKEKRKGRKVRRLQKKLDTQLVHYDAMFDQFWSCLLYALVVSWLLGDWWWRMCCGAVVCSVWCHSVSPWLSNVVKYRLEASTAKTKDLVSKYVGLPLIACFYASSVICARNSVSHVPAWSFTCCRVNSRLIVSWHLINFE